MGPADIGALQLLVPGAEVLLDAVRGLPGVALLEPAHISLGYPWRGAQAALAAAPEVRATAATTPAFDIEFRSLRQFAPDSRGRVLVYVSPVDEQPVRLLATALGCALGQVHLSVGRLLAGTDPLPVRGRVEPLLPIRVPVDTLELTVRLGGRWQPGLRWELGGRP